MYACYVNKWMDVYGCVWGLEHAWGHLWMYSGLCYRDSDMQKCEDLCSCQNVLLSVVFSVGIFVFVFVFVFFKTSLLKYNCFTVVC